MGFKTFLKDNVDKLDVDLRRYLCFLNNDKSVNWDVNLKDYVGYLWWQRNKMQAVTPHLWKQAASCSWMH